MITMLRCFLITMWDLLVSTCPVGHGITTVPRCFRFLGFQFLCTLWDTRHCLLGLHISHNDPSSIGDASLVIIELGQVLRARGITGSLDYIHISISRHSSAEADLSDNASRRPSISDLVFVRCGLFQRYFISYNHYILKETY